MTSVEKLTHIKDGKRVRSRLVHFPHYEVQGAVGNESIQVWLDDKQIQLLLDQLEKSVRIQLNPFSISHDQVKSRK